VSNSPGMIVDCVARLRRLPCGPQARHWFNFRNCCIYSVFLNRMDIVLSGNVHTHTGSQSQFDQGVFNTLLVVQKHTII
jgi:hypothetical protein